MKKTIILVVAVLVGSLFTMSTAQDSATPPIILRGATTCESWIAPWVKEFTEKNPVPGIDMKGTTMGEGFRAFISKRADILMAARQLSEDEQKLATERGAKLKEFFLGNDGIAIIINPENPVNELSLDQLAKLWSGEYANWKQVGGLDETVSLCVLSPDSAMSQFLAKDVLKTSPVSTALVIPDATRTVITIMTRKGGISYCRTELAFQASRENKLKCLALKKDSHSPAVPLSLETIRDGSFPIIRPIMLVIDDNSAGGPIRKLVDFCVNKASQGSPRN